jgi:hypothetical protein
MNVAQRKPITESPSDQAVTRVDRHNGPPLSALTVGHVGLFLGGLVSVAALAGGDRFPSPFDPQEAIVRFFADHGQQARIGGVFYFASALPLGIFAATVSSRLRFLGVRAAGESIAQYGGTAASLALAATGLSTWTLGMIGSLPESAAAVRTLNALTFAVGGPALVVFSGVLVAGVAVTSGFARLLPRWMVGLGVGIGLLSGLSTAIFLVPQSILLLPAARFSGLLWLIAASAMLPRSGRVTERPE